MANSQTEHSKRLRAKTANEYNKRQMAEGKFKQFTVRLDAELANEFNALLATLAESKPKAIKALCEIHKKLTEKLEKQTSTTDRT